MIFTVKEAKTKVCMFAILLLNQTEFCNSQKCIASGCMAWRWFDFDEIRGFCGVAGLAKFTKGEHNDTT